MRFDCNIFTRGFFQRSLPVYLYGCAAFLILLFLMSFVINKGYNCIILACISFLIDVFYWVDDINNPRLLSLIVKWHQFTQLDGGDLISIVIAVLTENSSSIRHKCVYLGAMFVVSHQLERYSTGCRLPMVNQWTFEYLEDTNNTWCEHWLCAFNNIKTHIYCSLVNYPIM